MEEEIRMKGILENIIYDNETQEVKKRKKEFLKGLKR